MKGTGHPPFRIETGYAALIIASMLLRGKQPLQALTTELPPELGKALAVTGF
jgi:hypothetical protein